MPTRRGPKERQKSSWSDSRPPLDSKKVSCDGQVEYADSKSTNPWPIQPLQNMKQM